MHAWRTGQALTAETEVVVLSIFTTMLSLTTDRMDNFKLPPDYPFREALWSSLGSPIGAASGSTRYAHSSSISTGSDLTSPPSTGGNCAPVGSWSSSRSSYHGRHDDLETDSELEEESTARMQSRCLPSGLLQDEGREYQDSFPMFPADLEIPGTKLCGETARRHQELVWRGLYQDHYVRNGFVEERGDQGFDSISLSSNKGSVGGRFSTPRPTPEMVFIHEEAIGRATKSALLTSFQPCVPVVSDNVNLSYFSGSQPIAAETVSPQMICNFQERMTTMLTLRDMEHAYAALRKELDEIMEGVRARKELPASPADLRKFAETQTIYEHDGLVGDPRGLANNIGQSYSLERIGAELRDEALASLPNRTYQQGRPTSSTEWEKARNDTFRFNGMNDELMIHLNWPTSHSQMEAELSQRTSGTGFSSPRPTTVNNACSCPASATSCSSTAARIYSEAFRSRPRDPRQEIPCVCTRSLGNTPVKKPNAYPCNSDSPPTRKSTSACSKGGGAVHTSRAADNNVQGKYVSVTGFHPGPSPISSPPIKSAENGSAEIGSHSSAKTVYHPFQTPLPEQSGSKDTAAFAGQDARSSDGISGRLPNSPATKAVIAQGAKSISVILKHENSASRSRSSYPASSCKNGSSPVSPGSGSLSPIRPRRLNMSNADTLQLIPMANPSVELDVCNQGQFKTELCNNWQETQWCRYGDHCRFAHGVGELRYVLRHHRYKSVPCRMIMSGKDCIYGHRCHYRHSLTEKELSLISEARLISRSTSM